jgi:hypothetical protein
MSGEPDILIASGGSAGAALTHCPSEDSNRRAPLVEAGNANCAESIGRANGLQPRWPRRWYGV